MEDVVDVKAVTAPDASHPDVVVLARNVCKSFNGVPVLKGINLEVHRGKVVAILGPSGSGKSTFLRCINHLETMDSGSITVDGVQIGYVRKGGTLTEASYAETARQRHRIGMVFQSFNLFPHMTVLENVMEVPVRVHKEDPVVVRERALKLLAKVGLADKAGEYPRRLSGGQQQRVSIARALLKDAPILILDEATSSVDTRTEVLIQQGMDELMKNRTSFVIAHRLSTIRDADTIIVMRDGDIVEIGNHEGLLKENGFYATLYRSQFENGQ